MRAGAISTGATLDPLVAFAELGRMKLGESDLQAVLGRVAELARQTLPGMVGASVTLVESDRAAPKDRHGYASAGRQPVVAENGTTGQAQRLDVVEAVAGEIAPRLGWTPGGDYAEVPPTRAESSRGRLPALAVESGQQARALG